MRIGVLTYLKQRITLRDLKEFETLSERLAAQSSMLKRIMIANRMMQCLCARRAPWSFLYLGKAVSALKFEPAQGEPRGLDTIVGFLAALVNAAPFDVSKAFTISEAKLFFESWMKQYVTRMRDYIAAHHAPAELEKSLSRRLLTESPKAIQGELSVKKMFSYA